MADLSITGQVYRDGVLAPATIHIDREAGIIEDVGDLPALDDHIDFGDRAILPGAIDVHVHFRDPGQVHKEDWGTGSASAAHGGVTAVVDMPNTVPPTTTTTRLVAKLKEAKAKSHVDYGVWCGGTWFTEDLPAMLPHSAGIKVYLGATTGDLLLDDRNRIQQILETAGKAGKPVILHCEAERVLKQFRATEKEPRDHDLCRPAMAEVEAIYDVMRALPSIKEPPTIHIAHIASVEAVQAAEAAKFSRGVCPHHILLDHERDWLDNATYAKMNPPLRSAAARDQLFDAFAEGRIPIVESDHAPHTKTEKAEAFHTAPAGVPGVETMVPLLLAKVQEGKLGLATVVDACTQAPAALLGLEDRGRIEAGFRADLAVYDMDEVNPVAEDELHSKAGWTPFVGMPAIFPSDVFVGGRRVIDTWGLVGAPGQASPLWPLPEGL